MIHWSVSCGFPAITWTWFKLQFDWGIRATWQLHLPPDSSYFIHRDGLWRYLFWWSRFPSTNSPHGFISNNNLCPIWNFIWKRYTHNKWLNTNNTRDWMKSSDARWGTDQEEGWIRKSMRQKQDRWIDRWMEGGWRMDDGGWSMDGLLTLYLIVIYNVQWDTMSYNEINVYHDWSQV